MINKNKEKSDIFDELIFSEILKARENGVKPKMLLHVCCAVCASHVLNILKDEFNITIYYYNPNIYPREEYEHRLDELRKLVRNMGLNIEIIEPTYNADEYYEKCSNFASEREGGSRCSQCFKLRLKKTAEYAKENGFDMFATTLTISPHKNSEIINAIGNEIAEDIGVHFAMSNFKKKEGFKKANALCEKYDVYRQVYCGCKYSIPKDVEN